MHNLIRMDLYRMRKAKGWLVSLILMAVFALGVTPFTWGLSKLGQSLGGSPDLFPATADLAEIIAGPLPFLNAMLAMIAACMFFYSDLESGYIKNIAGQMPKRGYTVLSKYIAVMVQNFFFMVVGVVCVLAGTLPFQRIVVETGLAHGVLVFVLKFLLLQACCAILLLVVASFRSKSLGSVLAVLLGTGLLSVVYSAINAGLGQIFKLGDFSIARYMPDQLLGNADPDPLRALLASAVTIGIFLPLSIHVFDRRDVK